MPRSEFSPGLPANVGVNICTNAARIVTWKQTDRRRTFQSSGFPSADASYVCKGYATGGWGVHQARGSIKSWGAKTPEEATRDNTYTPTGHTYSVYWDCTRCGTQLRTAVVKTPLEKNIIMA